MHNILYIYYFDLRPINIICPTQFVSGFVSLMLNLLQFRFFGSKVQLHWSSFLLHQMLCTVTQLMLIRFDDLVQHILHGFMFCHDAVMHHNDNLVKCKNQLAHELQKLSYVVLNSSHHVSKCCHQFCQTFLREMTCTGLSSNELNGLFHDATNLDKFLKNFVQITHDIPLSITNVFKLVHCLSFFCKNVSLLNFQLKELLKSNLQS